METHLKVIIAVLPIALLVGPLGTTLAIAQPRQNGPTSQNARAPYAAQYEGRITVRANHTATEVFTKRFKILTPSAIQLVGQQQLLFMEGMQTLDTIEAFTEKSDGRRIPVDPASIITRDAVSGLPGTYLRDLKQRTVIFPDAGIGDTLVMTHKRETMRGLFPGQFIYADVFPRSQAFTSAQVTVEASGILHLHVKTTGKGIIESVEESDDIRRHTIVIVPASYEPEEAGAVSPLDRDPALLISTFKSYEELASAYAAAALPKAAVTPEITSLANEITKGIDDKKAQAIAIDAWMKKNIRYVAVFLSLGRVVPNDAATVLKNKFGDCKDKVTLMSALLAAKGIAGEAALINLGNAYTLPEPPTLAALNHVILYLPDFDLYADPTASWAGFGILAPEAYDKPVVHVSLGAARRAHTPAMKPEDHTTYARTIINVAADGAVTGQTEESGTGVFGSALRVAGAAVQNLGNETAAQRQLQSFNTPGTGHFDLGNSAETMDPVAIKSSFTLNERFKPPSPGVSAPIPFGMPLLLRPGNFLLGRRLNGRKSAFACYAGRQTEDIDATFDQGLPMPVPLMPRTIDKPAFSYRSTFKVEGRTLKMHREFISRVSRQSCPPELEAEIADDMNTVRINVNSAFSFGGRGPAPAPNSPRPPQMVELTRAVAADQKLRVEFLYSLNPDCTSIGFATVRLVEEPKHGKITVENGTGFPRFIQDNPRYECNRRSADGVVVSYEPNAGFTGTDSIIVDVIFASGTSSKRHYSIEVK